MRLHALDLPRLGPMFVQTASGPHNAAHHYDCGIAAAVARVVLPPVNSVLDTIDETPSDQLAASAHGPHVHGGLGEHHLAALPRHYTLRNPRQ